MLLELSLYQKTWQSITYIGFTIFRPLTSVQDVLTTHPGDVEVFHSQPNWWTNQAASTSTESCCWHSWNRKRYNNAVPNYLAYFVFHFTLFLALQILQTVLNTLSSPKSSQREVVVFKQMCIFIFSITTQVAGYTDFLFLADWTQIYLSSILSMIITCCGC